MNLQDIKYNDLKRLCAANGLDAKGTAEELRQRLQENNVQPAQEQTSEAETQPEQELGQVPPVHPAPPVARPTAQFERTAEAKATRALRADAQKMKEHLAKQPKVQIMIPFEEGMTAETAKHVPFHINLNGYKMDLPRGQYIEVPQQVADVIIERLQSEKRIGANVRVDASRERINALRG